MKNIQIPNQENVEAIELLKALERLEQNRDYQKVIVEGYMKEEVLRANSLLAEPSIKAQGRRPDVMEILVGVSSFNQYLKTIRTLGANARYQETHPNTKDNSNGDK